MDKKISVVMCTFNGEKYLREQLDSILNQTYPIYEIYIQDDCSTDNTASILKEYQEKFPIISYSVNKENLGVHENFFSAFEKVSGEFIAISDQDDIWLPEKLQKVAEMIGENLLCFSRSIPFSNDGSFFHFDKEIPNYGLERRYCRKAL
jgi:glycosyltransferase involved in cell wall biosynthesis